MSHGKVTGGKVAINVASKTVSMKHSKHLCSVRMSWNLFQNSRARLLTSFKLILRKQDYGEFNTAIDIGRSVVILASDVPERESATTHQINTRLMGTMSARESRVHHLKATVIDLKPCTGVACKSNCGTTKYIIFGRTPRAHGAIHDQAAIVLDTKLHLSHDNLLCWPGAQVLRSTRMEVRFEKA